MTGIDASADALRVAQEYDSTGTVKYLEMDAYQLSFAEESFDAVLAMDFLEHVQPYPAVEEMARVLKPGGLLFFNTFSRNWLSWLVCIKGVEWFVANTPKDMHVIELFISPKELKKIFSAHGLEVIEMKGVRPKLNAAFFNMLRTKEVEDSFEFTSSISKALGYCGVVRKTR